uniref:Citrate transport protein n=1 Tax=Strigamia maritima TaxID=126957 RepID=T1J6I0_STRMM
MDRNNRKEFKNPFGRPWMTQNGAALAASDFLPSQKSLKGVIAGGITGGIEICITFPTEFVKTQLQLDERAGKTRQYSGIVDCVQKTVKSRGVLGLYRGLSVLVYGSVPKSGLAHMRNSKKRRVDSNGNLSPFNRLICGLGAGVCEALLAVIPMETIKVKFIHDQNQPKPKYRIRGTYQGVTATCMKQGSNQAIRFYVMESLKDWYRGGDSKKPVNKIVTGFFGAIAGAASVFGNTPIDVVKTRMQGLEASKYKNTVDCAMKIWKNEGPRAFYKGTVPRLSRVCLDVAITFMIYDSFMEFFNTFWKTD